MSISQAVPPRCPPAARCRRQPAGAGTISLGPCEITDREFHTIRNLIYQQAGIALAESKRALVCSRLAKRLRHLGLGSLSDYLDYLDQRDADGRERQQMVNCLTTNKTDFFREPHHFEFLRRTVFPQIESRAARGAPRRLRIWSAGCSMGHEPYSIAITILEHFLAPGRWDIRILASDINTEVLDVAARGVYPADQIEPVPEAIRRKYFLRGRGESAGQCQVRPELKQLVTFRQVNLTARPWPMQALFDVIFCRNVIIYFNLATQQELTLRLADQLAENGYLMLGHSEHPAWLSGVLSAAGQTIYQRRPAASRVPAATRLPLPQTTTARVGRIKPAPIAPCAAPPQASPAIEARDIIAGQYFAAARPTRISTLLGSCVAACLFDPTTRIGGMNHFLLPYHTADEAVSARYGVHAMELLINAIMKLGGDRRRLQAKVFGGANVLGIAKPSCHVGQRNSRFVAEFLETERIPLVARRLGGERPLRVHFLTGSGRAFVKPLPYPPHLAEREDLVSREATRLVAHPQPDRVLLF